MYINLELSEEDLSEEGAFEVYIFKSLNLSVMKKSNKVESVVVATNEGRLYIRTADFFKQEKIKETIEKLKNSKIVKQINEKNKLVEA